MDLDKIYKKLDKLDTKLDAYMIQTENRLTKLETTVISVQSSLKIMVMSVVGVVSTAVTYMIQKVFNS
jgi:hypothetical protein